MDDSEERKRAEAEAWADMLAERVRRRAASGAASARQRLADLSAQYAHLSPRAAALLQSAMDDFERAPDFFAAVARHRFARELVPEAEAEQDNVIEGTATIVEETDDSGEKGKQ